MQCVNVLRDKDGNGKRKGHRGKLENKGKKRERGNNRGGGGLDGHCEKRRRFVLFYLPRGGEKGTWQKKKKER